MPTLTEAYKLAGPPVAAQPQDKWIPSGELYDRIAVVTEEGRFFVHSLGLNGRSERTVEEARELATPQRVATNPADKHVVAVGDNLLVITESGDVFAHPWVQRRIPPSYEVGAAQKLNGPPVAAKSIDRFVVDGGGGTILVTTTDGRVFCHQLSTYRVGEAFQLNGPPVAANEADAHVIRMVNYLVVITKSGLVFAHKFNLADRVVSEAVRVEGPPVAAIEGVDRHVLAMGASILVITRDGRVFAHNTSLAPRIT